MAHIAEADYETITVACDDCHETRVYNRVSDIGEVGPYVGRTIVCAACSREFWITMDVAGSAYEQFIHDADSHFARKRYMLTVASLAQAWEIFFSTFADATFVFRPFFAAQPNDRDVARLNAVHHHLHEALKRFSFFDLRNLVLNVMVERIAPRTLAEAEQQIARINNERFDRDVARKTLRAVSDGVLSELLLQLRDVTIGSLRKRVVHQYAYRPNRGETQIALESEVVLLYRLEKALRIGDFNNFSAGVVR